MIKTNYYQMPDKDYKSAKPIGRALEEVYANLIHIEK
jgi:DNA-directed RNA polymerase subunit K/omega